MKKQITALLLVLLSLGMIGCSKEAEKNTPLENTTGVSNKTEPTPIDESEDTASVPDAVQTDTDTSSLPASTEEISQSEEYDKTALVIQISDGENVISFQLNNSKAAKELYTQLPLSLPVEDYSDNEKIFYPPNTLDTSDAPKAGGEAGTLAYYEPWADVVMFFGSYSPNDSLYELGQMISGSEQIQLLEGTITIETVP